jgi:hypothetical protein
MTKSVDVVNHNSGGGVGPVDVTRSKEVDGRTRMTRSRNLEPVPAFRLEEHSFESAVALLENATMNLGNPFITSHTDRLTLHLLRHGVPRRAEQSLFNVLRPVDLGGVRLRRGGG